MRNGCEYFPDDFSQSSQIHVLSGGVNRFWKTVYSQSRLTRVTAGRIDGKAMSIAERSLGYVTFAKSVSCDPYHAAFLWTL